jgi:hypothetical protein
MGGFHPTASSCQESQKKAAQKIERLQKEGEAS